MSQAIFESLASFAGSFTSSGPQLARHVFDDVKSMKDMGSTHFNVAAGIVCCFVAGAMSFNPITLLIATAVAACEYGERGGVFGVLGHLDSAFYRGIFYIFCGVMSGSGLGSLLLATAGLRHLMAGYKDWAAEQQGGRSPSPGYSTSVPMWSSQAAPSGCAQA